MKKILASTALIVALSQISACTMSREQSGGLMGAVAGGVVGNQVGGGRGKDLATAIGIFAGAMAGSNFGKQLDALDIANANRALETNKSNQTSSWVNPDNGNKYSVTPTKTYKQASGRYCREYQSTVTVGGKLEDSYGKACRQPDGSWEII
ncbi:MAG: RT0821/Lpp0805 family surface protein [Arenicellales bacterium]